MYEIIIWSFSYCTRYQPSTHISPHAFGPQADMGSRVDMGYMKTELPSLLSGKHSLKVMSNTCSRGLLEEI